MQEMRLPAKQFNIICILRKYKIFFAKIYRNEKKIYNCTKSKDQLKL